MLDIDIQNRLAAEKSAYSTEMNRRGLPPIFSNWSVNFIRPKLEQVFGVSDHVSLYSNEFAQLPVRPLRLLSIGSGTSRLEINIAKALLARGIPFKFDCLELSPDRIKLAENMVRESGVPEHAFRFIEADANLWTPDCTYQGIMANHSLHHIVQLERVFGYISQALDEDGLFVSIDMIGRNGHMRWPEVLIHVERLWDELPERCRMNDAIMRLDTHFDNRDFSG